MKNRRTITTPDGYSVVQVQAKNGLWLTESRTPIVAGDFRCSRPVPTTSPKRGSGSSRTDAAGGGYQECPSQ